MEVDQTGWGGAGKLCGLPKNSAEPYTASKGRLLARLQHECRYRLLYWPRTIGTIHFKPLPGPIDTLLQCLTALSALEIDG